MCLKLRAREVNVLGHERPHDRAKLLEPVGVVVTLAGEKLLAVLGVLAAVVAKINFARIHTENFHLARGARHREACATGQPRHANGRVREDLPAFHERYLEGLVAGGETTLQDVVLGAADVRQLAEYLGQHVRVVVESSDQRALVDALRAALKKFGDTGPGLVGQLTRVVEVAYEVDAPVEG